MNEMSKEENAARWKVKLPTSVLAAENKALEFLNTLTVGKDKEWFLSIRTLVLEMISKETAETAWEILTNVLYNINFVARTPERFGTKSVDDLSDEVLLEKFSKTQVANIRLRVLLEDVRNEISAAVIGVTAQNKQ